MRIRKRTETIIETHEVWVIRRQGSAGPAAMCATCEARPPMAKPAEAARLAGVNTRTVYRWVEAGRVHFIEVPEGDLFVCLASLPDNAG